MPKFSSSSQTARTGSVTGDLSQNINNSGPLEKDVISGRLTMRDTLSETGKLGLRLLEDLTASAAGGSAAWLHVTSLPRTFSLELIEFVLSNYISVFKILLPYEQVLRHQICSLLMTSLRTSSELEGEMVEPYIRRLVLRSVAHIIRLYSSSLITECEVFLSMLVKATFLDLPLWHRILVLEILRGFCVEARTLQILFQNFDMHPKNTNVVESMVKALARVVSSIQFQETSEESLAAVAGMFSSKAKGIEWILDNDASSAAVLVASEAHAITLAIEGLLGVVFTVATLTDEAVDTGELESPRYELHPSSDNCTGKTSRLCISMIESLWLTILDAFSLILSRSQGEAIVLEILKGYQAFTQACGVLHAVEPLNSFLASLCKFTIVLPTDAERKSSIVQSPVSKRSEVQVEQKDVIVLTPKNVQALRTLFNIAHRLHNVLGASWVLVLETLAALDRAIHSPHATTQEVATAVPKLTREPSRQYADFSILSSLNSQLFESSALMHVSAVKSLLSALYMLSHQSMTETSDSVSSASSKKIGSISFSVDRMISILVNNLHRVEPLWDQVVSHFLELAVHSNPNLRSMALDALDQSICAVLGSEQFGEDPPRSRDTTLDVESKSTELKSVECVVLSSLRGLYFSAQKADVRVGSLKILLRVLERCGEKLYYSWPGILEMLRSVADASEKDVATLGFQSLRVIMSDGLPTLPEDCLYVCIDVTGAYSAQKTDLNISLTAIGLLWTLTDFIAKGLHHGCQVEKGSGFSNVDTSPQQTNGEGVEEHVVSNSNKPDFEARTQIVNHEKLLFLVFSLIQKLVDDDRPEVRNSAMIRIVGLSATLPSYLQVAQFLRVNPDIGLFYFDSSYRPVPLAQQYIGITEHNFAAKNALLNEICYKKVADSIRQGHQAMIFVHSRKDTSKTAEKLIDLARENETLDLFTNETHPQFHIRKKDVIKSRNKDLVKFFEAGFGIHHAGMLRSDRTLTERLFSDGLLKVLVCTATLAWGVNLPAHTVVIKGTQLYDAKAGGWKDLGMLDVMQIFGRAGRPQFDKSGEGIIITSHDKLAYYLRLLTSQLPIESQFISSLKDNLNAEVVLGTVTNVKEACAWLGYTYLSIRMKLNPLAYGIGWDEIIADPSLTLKQRALVSEAARSLDKAKMMRFDEKSGNFYCTELGRVASHFYIQYSSVETYNEMLKRHMNESEIIDMVAHSSEFENIVVREEEQHELETLARSCCPLEVKGGPSNKHGKISILIQLFISRGSIDAFSLVSDASYISASLARIMRALFETCLRKGWCEMTLFMLEYCKAVDRQLWPHQHPLRQFDRDIPFDTLRKLEERGADLDRLYEMEEKDIGALIRYNPGGRLVKQHLAYFPSIQLEATVSPITRTVLKVDLRITPDFIWKDRFHGAALRWWILIEDTENDYIYHSDLFTLTKRMARGEPQKLSFTVPIFEPHPPQYYVHAISDSWLHAESFYTISFHNLALPEARTSHTELLDLKPLPVTSLGNRLYESLYKFSHFNPIQTQIFHVLYHTDNNVLVGAPTGSGKTISAELAMLRLFSTQPDMKVVYIAPLKAIVRERMKDWKKHLVAPLGKEMVEMTGDYTPDLVALLSADIIISTPEKWDGISRNWHTRSYVKKVGLVILDEIHLLGADRGPILEVIVSRMRYISSQTERSVRFVGLSTALANAGDLADWLGVGEIGLFNFKPSVRPVPIEVHIQGYPGKYYCPRMNSMNKPAYAAICTHSPTKPVLIFVSSRRQTRLTALDLIQFAASDEHPRQFLSVSEEDLQMVLSQITDQNLRHTLQFGIGLHHAGLNDQDRSVVEELFVNNKIQVLVSTSTLAWGVNLPAHLVIIKGTEYFDGKTKRYVDFPLTEILQMMGRAGRPQFDQHGKAVILVHEPKKSFYKKFLYEPFPVESSLKERLHDHFNAEIVSGTIGNKEDAVHYLTWTYLFRRLMANPAYYGLEGTEDESVCSYLSRLVQNTFDDLEDSGCLKVTEDSVEPMMLGTIASQYYLSYMTVSMFGSNIGPDTSLEAFLHILAGASEYDELPVRHNEENYNKTLSEKVRYRVDNNHLDDPHTKANLLFQAHFSQLALPISDYNTDLKSVLDQSIRILQAMIDICANSGWLTSSLTCMRLLQMVMQGMWSDQDSSLWMIPCMNDDLLGSLTARGIHTLHQLLELPRETLKSVTGNFPASKLSQDLQRFPRIQMNVRLQRKDPNGPSTLEIRLEKISKRNTSRALAPRFPKVKDEAWWLVLGDTSTSELFAVKRVSFTGRLITRMELPPNITSLQDTKLILVSDCYLGFEQEHSIEQRPARR